MFPLVTIAPFSCLRFALRCGDAILAIGDFAELTALAQALRHPG